MGAPATTAKQARTGIRLKDGHSTVYAFAADPTVKFYEKTVTPPGIEGGDPIDTTTMHNVTWRTMAARALRTLTESQTTCAYDPDVYNEILNLINVEDSITIHFPDLSTLSFWGFVQNFQPDALQEGEQPEATITVVPTNTDPDDGTEAAPVLTSVDGT